MGVEGGEVCGGEDFTNHFLVGVGVGGGDEAFVSLEKVRLLGERSFA